MTAIKISYYLFSSVHNANYDYELWILVFYAIWKWALLVYDKLSLFNGAHHVAPPFFYRVPLRTNLSLVSMRFSSVSKCLHTCAGWEEKWLMVTGAGFPCWFGRSLRTQLLTNRSILSSTRKSGVNPCELVAFFNITDRGHEIPRPRLRVTYF